MTGEPRPIGLLGVTVVKALGAGLVTPTGARDTRRGSSSASNCSLTRSARAPYANCQRNYNT